MIGFFGGAVGNGITGVRRLAAGTGGGNDGVTDIGALGARAAAVERADTDGSAAVGFTLLPGRPGGSMIGFGATGWGVGLGRNAVVFTFARPRRPRRACGSNVARTGS